MFLDSILELSECKSRVPFELMNEASDDLIVAKVLDINTRFGEGLAKEDSKVLFKLISEFSQVATSEEMIHEATSVCQKIEGDPIQRLRFYRIVHTLQKLLDV